ncbi:ABC transporter substrate-binding protein [Candidatus Thiodiazotropha sp. CDECU1]|uniref:ABC transporter substrate-binding protein n=1 Tax=Candidatus Thiodiazotropha sp. CDECU1 TaxID=3065865 RepID=UPI002931E3D1|nr:ABC transporter substrate binding protein [Candidatus Thiodiazotropha sp. CDECU1]
MVIIPTAKNVMATMLVLLIALPFSQAMANKCLFISSYHKGYAWSDGVENGLRETLDGKCDVKQFDMDTKRHKDEESKKEAALKAKELIESWKPDVVITADDNAAKYVIKPFFKDHKVPFVFCGVNWNVDEYGFPYSNATGIVEVAPIDVLFDNARHIQGGAHQAIYIGANTLTEKKNLNRFKRAAEKHGILMDHRLVNTTKEWLDAYKEAQGYDFVVIGSNSGINDWYTESVSDYVVKNTTTLTLTNHGWMMPYTLLGLTKIPEEHGEWAALAALAILDGIKPSEIPIVSNRKWDIWINHAILQQSGIRFPESLLRKAKKVNS